MVDDTREKEQRNADRDRAIQARAMRDAAFRQAFVDDPKGTLEREFGATLPAGVSIQVHEESADTIHFVLPGRPGAGGDDDPDAPKGMRAEKKTDCCTCGSSTHQTFKIPD